VSEEGPNSRQQESPVDQWRVLSLEETELSSNSDAYSSNSSNQSWQGAAAEVARQNKAARRSRRNHRQRVKRAQSARQEQVRSERAARSLITDNDHDPLYLTNMTRPRSRFSKRNLLGTSVSIQGKRTTALLDSGCEAKLVISKKFADRQGICYTPISREVGLPDGSKMAASRSDPVDLTVAGVTRQESAVVVDLAAFDCILGLPWLEDLNPVISWKRKKLLVPTPADAVEIDLDKDPCRSAVDSPSLLSTMQLQATARKVDPIYVVTMKSIEDGGGGFRGIP
jgi:gag-polyprotein putative aspartyl protease